MRKLNIGLLVIITLLALGLRLYNLGTNPSSLNWDEVSHGYNAFSILKTGSDEWGKVFPISNFRAYGDYPLTLNLYLTIPFIKLLGLNAFSIRLPHALLGVATVIAMYFFTYGITKKKTMSLVAGFLVAIGPWYVFTSRFVLQSNISVFLLVTAMAAFFNQKKHKAFLPLSLLLLGLTLFSYHTTRIFTPLLVIAMMALFRKQLVTKINIGILLLFFLPLPFILLNPSARARSNEVFLINEGAIAQIENQRNTSQMSPLLAKFIYNKPVYLIKNSARNYIDYLSPMFLFFKGGTQYQFSIPDHGLLFPVSAPFFYLGFIVLCYKSIKRRDRNYQLLLLWLILAPIPASITTEKFAVLRSTTLLPLPELLTVLGLFTFKDFLKIKYTQLSSLVLPVFVLLNFIFLAKYMEVYFGEYMKNYSWAWQQGYEEAVSFTKDFGKDYERLIITKKYGEPHEFVLFYSKWDPARYKSDPSLIRYTQSNWWWVDSFDKFVFVNDWQIPKEGTVFVTERKALVDCTDKRCALITSPGNAPRGWSRIKTITFLDGKTAFEIYENK